MNKDFLLSSYDYNLPESYIAQTPAKDSKLLVCHNELVEDKYFSDLPSILDQDTAIFFNNTKVYNARIPLSKQKIIRGSGNERIIDGEIFVYQIL
jgi:S-adenosylmethionine:tRNA ribosyltransferase-isomerase